MRKLLLAIRIIFGYSTIFTLQILPQKWGSSLQVLGKKPFFTKLNGHREYSQNPNFISNSSLPWRFNQAFSSTYRIMFSDILLLNPFLVEREVDRFGQKRVSAIQVIIAMTYIRRQDIGQKNTQIKSFIQNFGRNYVRRDLNTFFADLPI